jgi:WD40 repeat protein
MISFKNENILQLIFSSLNKRRTREMLSITNNKLLIQTMQKQIEFEKIFKSMGYSKVILEGCSKMFSSMALLSNGNIVTLKAKDGLMLINTKTNKVYKTLDEEGIESMINIQNGKIATCTINGLIKIWTNNDRFKCIKQIQQAGTNYKLFAVSKRYLVCCSQNEYQCYINIYDCNSNYKLIHVIKDGEYVNCLTGIANKRFASSQHQTIYIWEFNNCYDNCFEYLDGHEDTIYALLYVEEGNMLVSGSADKSITVWSLDNYECINSIYGHTDTIKHLLGLPCGFFASCSDDLSIKIWDLKNMECVNVLKTCKKRMVDLMVLLSDMRIACSGYGTIVLWDY